MFRTIGVFARHLRAAGVPVAPGEEMDCLQALEVTCPGQQSFYLALRCTLVKRQQDFMAFDRVFNFYFYVLLPGRMVEGCAGENNAMLNLAAIAETSGQSQGKPGAGTPAHQLIAALLVGNRTAMEQLVIQGIQRLGVITRAHLDNIDEIARQVQVAMEWFMAEHEIGKMVGRGELDQADTCRQGLDDLKGYIAKVVEEELWRALGEEAVPKILENLDMKQKDFSRFQQSQIAEIRKYITRLGRKLATRKSRHYRRSVRGQIDLRRTLRVAAASGGIPIKPAYRRHKIDRPEVVLLCDVSGSVATYSEFMLQLAYTAQKRFRWLRSYIFIDRVAEVSDLFGQMGMEEAVRLAYRRGSFSNSGLSDFGAVFRIFERQHMTVLSRRTSLIILGDARNNWRPAQAESLAALAGQSGKIIWLNPRPPELWYTEDSVLTQYQPYCHKVMECRNLEQLERISRMILHG